MKELERGATTQLAATWWSANPAVATVDDKGTVTAVAPGVVEIYHTAGEISAIVVVRVTEPAPAVTAPAEAAPSGAPPAAH